MAKVLWYLHLPQTNGESWGLSVGVEFKQGANSHKACLSEEIPIGCASPTFNSP
jgi:hypothetical protein